MAASHGNALPTQRQLRVAEQIRHILAEDLMRGEVHDPRVVDTSVTVADVRVSRDLKQATVYAVELGRELRPEVQQALQHAAPYLAGRLARRMNLKYAPRLVFVADRLFDAAAHVDELMARERARLGTGRDEADGKE